MELRSATRARSISSIINDDLFSEELRREITTITRPTRVLLKDLNFPSMTNLLSDRGDFYSNANSPDSSDDETMTTTLVTKHRPSNVNIDTIRPLELIQIPQTTHTNPRGTVVIMVGTIKVKTTMRKVIAHLLLTEIILVILAREDHLHLLHHHNLLMGMQMVSHPTIRPGCLPFRTLR